MRIAGGLPLAENPAVGALLGLLRAVAPLPGAPGEMALPRRAVVEAWRSPYFAWDCAASADDPTPVGIRKEDARALDAAARAGRAIRGLAQWREALDLWARRGGEAAPASEDEDALPDEGDGAGPAGPSPEDLRARFERFVTRLTPPRARTYRAFVRWVEDLIGPDPLPPQGWRTPPPDTYSLRMVERIREGACSDGDEEEPGATDLAALARLKDVLRGLVWAEEALGLDRAVDYSRFLQEVAGAVEAERYEVPARGDRGAITVAEVHTAAGVGFGSLAVLGLAEGEFPAPRRDDPLLTDAERRALRAHDPALALPPLLESRETEAFCRLAASAREGLFLTRPRLAETGAAWAPSPFWEEVLRQVAVRPRALTSDAAPDPVEVCSWPELLAALAARGASDLLEERLAAWGPVAGPAYDLLAAERTARAVLAARTRRALGPHEGDLAGARDTLAARFRPERPWSASRLESYRSCPLAFFFGSVLGLEPRPEPAEGPDARQLGNLYHRILEEVYRSAGGDAGDDCDALLAALPEVARRVLDAAPAEEGFRETPWWEHTRAEIVEHVRQSIVALAEAPTDTAPWPLRRAFSSRTPCTSRSTACAWPSTG